MRVGRYMLFWGQEHYATSPKCAVMGVFPTLEWAKSFAQNDIFRLAKKIEEYEFLFDDKNTWFQVLDLDTGEFVYCSGSAYGDGDEFIEAAKNLAQRNINSAALE